MSTRRSSVSPFRYRKAPAPAPPACSAVVFSSSSSTASAGALLSKHPATLAQPSKAKENVTVTVRFRPLSSREISKGDEVAWYADGDCNVRNEFNSDITYGFDRVFGPATTTRQVYDVAAQHVVSSAMKGVNGTVFAYGVTSSGKTHTMHGEQKSPGIIPLAVKDVFGIIQETPGREFLLRVSYLEIYNEVINDLLNPTGQNLRIREDSQGTYVEGIKEEVVLSPAHALSLIASGEEHRHVGSNNFNLLSSRSHTIFTLTIESSLTGESEDVTLSQLHLIDLAGSESSKTGTIGLRRKEGSYINKSLLTLGTVISKLTDGKSTHIPYRDSKLTRLLQSSLSGHGCVSLICTVTPASSNTEETHNTLKFAQRSKHVEIKASPNKILDEKSLIKKYQKEISNLKQELEQLKRGMMEKEHLTAPSREDLVNIKLQLEAGQIKLQSRLEEEEQAKAALMGRIQRLTKLILVSTKTSTQSNMLEEPSHRRRHSFGEDELAYLPDRKRGCVIDEDNGSVDSERSVDGKIDATNLDELVQDYKRNTRRGMLGWFKLRKPEAVSSPSTDHDSSASGSPASSSKLSGRKVMFSDIKDARRKSVSGKVDETSAAAFPERTQAGDLFSAAAGVKRLPPTGSTITDQMDLLREQIKMLAGEVALATSSLKRVSEQAAKNPDDSKLQESMQRLKDEIRGKKRQMRILEQRMIGSIELSPYGSSIVEMSQALSRLATQLNEKTFELEIKSADNRILQEQLRGKTMENNEMQETITQLKQQIESLMQHKNSKSADSTTRMNSAERSIEVMNEKGYDIISYDETSMDENTPTSAGSLNKIFNHDGTSSKSRLLVQAAEIESLKHEMDKLTEEKDEIEIQCQKQTEEASYAKELASAAAVELRNLAEEVTKLSYQNAKLTADLACCKANCCKKSTPVTKHNGVSIQLQPGRDSSSHMRKSGEGLSMEEFEVELNARYQREASLVAALAERDRIEGDLRKRFDDAKRREEKLENELANMWVLVAKLRKGHGVSDVLLESNLLNGSATAAALSSDNVQKCEMISLIEEESKACCYQEAEAGAGRRNCKEVDDFGVKGWSNPL
ncbi:kinesin-like protein KIN-7C, mitochondrial [Andrographis paniculata]|uniref:kinesin-like protein KIN-7C, mitochondrial n=1 Tax=Andrographis paniculata TaxID=175694 RepID=UPI0021E8A1B6|nr:kinesin-like protein KIN-7C, mitochondrial [Andrographis paniculata]